jgi:hypothetical protein
MPFLTSDFGYFKIPGLEKFELATAAAFDLGVFLGVVGSVMLALGGLSRLARRAAVGDSVGAHAVAEKPEARDFAQTVPAHVGMMASPRPPPKPPLPPEPEPFERKTKTGKRAKKKAEE